MTASPPPGISRLFRDLSDKDVAESENASLWARWGLSQGSKWEDLLKARRILIVSEAGAGKTYECQACQQRLWENGEPAFFLELATLADKEVSAMLGPAEQARQGSLHVEFGHVLTPLETRWRLQGSRLT